MEVNINKDGKNHKYKLIGKWEDVTLESWAKLMSIKTDSNIIENIESVEALSNIPKEIVKELSVHDISTLMHKIGSMQKEANNSLQHKITVNDKEYGFHPSLEDMTIGEYADIEMFIKDGVEKNMHNIAAILYRPITEQIRSAYTIEAYDGNIRLRAEEMKKMTAEQIQSCLVFFWSLGAVLLKTMQLCLMTEANKSLRNLLKGKTLQTAGAGSE